MSPPRAYLFVPATRLERVPRAWASGCDAVIVDLEDAVAEADKASARAAVAAASLDRAVHVRVNGPATSAQRDDLEVVAALAAAGTLAGVVLPMTEAADQVAAVAEAVPAGTEVIALVETPLALRRIDGILASPALSRVAFGSTDYCAALGVPRSAAVLAHPRAVLAVAAAAAGRPPAIDGPFLALDDDAGLADDVTDARALGLKAKLCIHPRQVPVVRRLLGPSDEDVARARAVLAAADAAGGGVFRWEGMMVDEPVLAAAREVVSDAGPEGGS